MTSYNLKPIVPPSIAAQEKKEARLKILEAVRERRKEIYQRFHQKMQLKADNALDTIAEICSQKRI